MSQHAAQPGIEAPRFLSDIRQAARKYTGYWWVFLVSGIAWLVIALVLLQFDEASVTTVGVLVGFMFLFAGVLNVALATVRLGEVPEDVRKRLRPLRIVAGVAGALFLGAAIVSFASPQDTFAGLADILGFLFLLVGVWWIARAFLERPVNPMWWLGLISGVLMTCLSFWTAGQFFVEKAYILLVFAGIWALMEGVNDIVRAFEVRRLHEEL